MIFIYLFCLAVIFSVCSVFIFCKHYNDGIIKKLSLCLLWIVCIGVIGDTIDGRDYQPLKVNVALVFGFTVFLVCHFYCWLKYVTNGDFSWPQIRRAMEKGAKTSTDADTPATGIATPHVHAQRRTARRATDPSPQV